MWMIPLTVLLSAYLYKDLSEIATYVQLGTPSKTPASMRPAMKTLCARLSEIAPHVQFDEDDKKTLSEMATLCAPTSRSRPGSSQHRVELEDVPTRTVARGYCVCVQSGEHL